MLKSLQLTLAASTLVLLSACAGQGNLGYDFQRYQYTTIGTAAGALAGGVLGHQFDDDDGRYYGAAAGALIGGALGNNMDQMRAYNSNVAPATGYNNPPYPQQDNRYPYNSGATAYAPPPPSGSQATPYY